MNSNEHITYFARTTFHNKGRLFGIKRADRRYHMYMIGRTGTGKSTLLETLVRDDISSGEGLALFDPHGDLVEKVFRSLPKEREALYLNLPDPRLRNLLQSASRRAQGQASACHGKPHRDFQEDME